MEIDTKRVRSARARSKRTHLVALCMLGAVCASCSTVMDEATTTTAATTPSAPLTTTTEPVAATTTTTVTDPLAEIANALAETLDRTFVYELDLYSYSTSSGFPPVVGIRNAEEGHVLEGWFGSWVSGTFVGEGIQAIGRPNQLGVFVGRDGDGEWTWLEIPDDLDGVFYVDHPEPYDDPVFRYDAALRELVASATSAVDARSAAITTFDGLEVLSRWDLTVPASAVMPFVGSGSENAWLVEQSDAPDLEVTVSLGFDEQGRFRQFEIHSDEFARFVHEQFGITGRRARGGFDFVIVIKSFDPDSFPVTHLGVPTEAIETIHADTYLSGADRPAAGSCVGHFDELSLPVFEPPEPCEYGVVALGPVPGPPGDEFPGYTKLWDYAYDACVAYGNELFGEDAVDDWNLSVHYSLPGPMAWALGDRSVMCGARL